MTYWFDNFFATDPMAKIYLVVVVNIVFVIFFGLCFHVAGSQDGDWAENFWKGFSFASDAAETVRMAVSHCNSEPLSDEAETAGGVSCFSLWVAFDLRSGVWK